MTYINGSYSEKRRERGLRSKNWVAQIRAKKYSGNNKTKTGSSM
jgi:hypothetical protein